jgi:hypothetical protein
MAVMYLLYAAKLMPRQPDGRWPGGIPILKPGQTYCKITSLSIGTGRIFGEAQRSTEKV